MNLKEYLNKKEFEQIKKDLKVDHDLAVPTVSKIIVNMGIGEAGLDKKRLKSLSEQLALITGQQPAIRKAKQAISAFDVKENQIIGLQVTLRKKRMYHFLKKLVSIILPAWREFKGVPGQSVTEQGDLTIGLTKNVVFPEIDYDTIEITNGMSITIVTTAKDREQGQRLFEGLGIVFETEEAREMREEAIERRREERMALAAKRKAYQELAKLKVKGEEEPIQKEEEKE